MGFRLGDYVDSTGHRTGGFMSGLFGGASNIFSLAHNYLVLKDAIADRSTAAEVRQAMLGQNSTGGLYDAPSATAGSGTSDATGGRFDGDTFDDDPLLSKLPKPGRIAKALKVFGDSPRKGTAYGAPVDQSSPTPAASSVMKGALGRLADQPGPGETETSPSGQTSTGGEPYPWLSQLGAALHAFGSRYNPKAPTQPQQPQQPPTYLPPQQPVGPAAPPAGPGTLETLQQHGALLAPGGVPYPNGPSLASQQDPRARILAAINPTTGAVS